MDEVTKDLFELNNIKYLFANVLLPSNRHGLEILNKAWDKEPELLIELGLEPLFDVFAQNISHFKSNLGYTEKDVKVNHNWKTDQPYLI